MNRQSEPREFSVCDELQPSPGENPRASSEKNVHQNAIATRRSFLLAGTGGVAALGAAVPLVMAQSQQPSGQETSVKQQASRWFFEPQDQSMISWLALPDDEKVLDAGCGRGQHLQLFSEYVAAGAVTGVDINESRISDIQARIGRGELRGNIQAVAADAASLPMQDGLFGCVWSSHTMHILPDPVAGVRELARLCKIGGRVVVREDRLLDRLLPFDVGLGKPGVEERAVAAFADWYIGDRQQRGKLPIGWLEVLRQAGLHNVLAKSFLFERQPPFTEEEIAYLRDRKIRGLIRDSLNEEDKRTLETLADEQSPAYAFDRNDLHFVSVATVYVGWKVA